MNSFSEQIIIERKTILEWNDKCTGGGIDPMRAITSEILGMLQKLEHPTAFDKMLSPNQRIDNMRVSVNKEPNFDSFRKRKLLTLDRLENSLKHGGKAE